MGELSTQANETESLREDQRVFFTEEVELISSSKCQVDPDFPSLLEVDDPLSHAVQIVDRSGLEANSTRNASIFSGRALFEKPLQSQQRLGSWDKKSVFLVKSTGVPRCVRRRWKTYGQEKPPFFFGGQEAEGDTQLSLTKTETFHGLATKEDQVADALGSVALYRAGARVRMPIAGWSVSELHNNGATLTINELKAMGFKGDEIYQSLWAISCPFRLEDVCAYLESALKHPEVMAQLDTFIQVLFIFVKNSSDSRYQTLVNTYGEDVISAGKDKKQLSSDTISAILVQFGVVLCSIMGENFDAMYKADLTHGNLHDQNITFFGELCDNSTVKSGKLQIGLAPENSADIDGFRSGMRKFSLLILRLSLPEATVEQANKMLENAFFPALRRGWQTYDQFVTDQMQLQTERIRKKQQQSAFETGDDFREENVQTELKTSNYLEYYKVFG